MYAILADIIVLIHFCIVIFCVGGEIAILTGAAFKWNWIRSLSFRIIHLCMVLYVAAEALLGMTCPLTDWEYNLRIASGQSEEKMSFIGRIIRSIIFYDFPAWVFTALYVGFGALILATFIFIKPVRKEKKT